MAWVIARNPGEAEFQQAVRVVAESVAPYITAYPYLMEQKILERIVEPDAQLSMLSAAESSPVIDRIKSVDLNTLTPIEAMNLLYELKNML